MTVDSKHTPLPKIARFNQIVDTIEWRCMAVDGPVSGTLEVASEEELSELWKLLNELSDLMKWRKSEDELPDQNVSVFVFIPEEDNHITVGMWDVSQKWVLLDEYRVPRSQVTYWAPMFLDVPEDTSYQKVEWNDELQKENYSLKEQNSKLSEEVELLKKANDGLRSQMNLEAFRNRDYTKIKEELLKSQQRHNASTKSYAELKEQNEKLREENEHMKKCAFDDACEITDHKKTYNSQCSRIDQLNDELDRLTCKNTHLLKLNKELNERIAELENWNEKWQERYNNAIKNDQSRIEELTKALGIIPPGRFRLLADFLDAVDRMKASIGIVTGDEVQQDLRRLADAQEALKI